MPAPRGAPDPQQRPPATRDDTRDTKQKRETALSQPVSQRRNNRKSGFISSVDYGEKVFLIITAENSFLPALKVSAVGMILCMAVSWTKFRTDGTGKRSRQGRGTGVTSSVKENNMQKKNNRQNKKQAEKKNQEDTCDNKWVIKQGEKDGMQREEIKRKLKSGLEF